MKRALSAVVGREGFAVSPRPSAAPGTGANMRAAHTSEAVKMSAGPIRGPIVSPREFVETYFLRLEIQAKFHPIRLYFFRIDGLE